jgi:hypothetical protein
MRIVLESTPQLVELDGVAVRVWEGRTERGVRVTAFVARLAVDAEANLTVFERELRETEPPVLGPCGLGAPSGVG